MQRFFARPQPLSHSLAARPATRADRAGLTRLTERARHTHFHLDWSTIDDWIDTASSGVWVATSGKQVAGALLAPSQDSPVAWVRLVAIADGYDVQTTLGALLPPASEALRAAGVESLACLAHPAWLADALPDLAFRPFIDVTHFRKDDRSIPDYGAPGVDVRRARPDDLPAVLINDRAAFDPIWWHTRDSLGRVLREVAHFVVAEIDGRIAGHAFSEVYDGRGHLIRLAVHPDRQGYGIGTRLLSESLTYLVTAGARSLTLNTQADNYASQSLYRRFGYLPTGDSTTVMLREIKRETRNGKGERAGNG